MLQSGVRFLTFTKNFTKNPMNMNFLGQKGVPSGGSLEPLDLPLWYTLHELPSMPFISVAQSYIHYFKSAHFKYFCSKTSKQFWRPSCFIKCLE